MRSLLTVATVVALALPLAPAATADPGDAPSLPPTASDTARERAEAALARAAALFDGRPAPSAEEHTPRRNATLALNELARLRTDLDPADRRRAERLLARPTDKGEDPQGDGYSVDEAPPECGDDVCVHYVTTTDDAPPTNDADGSGVPDVVERTLALAEKVHGRYTRGGYLPPDPDGGAGGDNRTDIYLADVGADRLYGYCTTDQPETGTAPWNRWAYCVVDDDFARTQFPANTPDENRRVTLAHEYFHAVQFAYDFFEDGWFLEATATWAEDELFDRINDNRAYLPYGQLQRPRLPLDEYDDGLAKYGQWIFFRHLSERWAGADAGLPRIVRQMWEYASGRPGDDDLYSTQAVQRVLARRKSSFTRAYGDFAVANRTPGRSYEEGSAYRRSRPQRVYALGRGDRATGPRRSWLDHQTHQTMRFRPRAGLGRGWRIRVKVDLPGRRTAPVARLVVVTKSGGVARRTVRLSRKGVGSRVARFNARRVKYVELVMGNASRRSDCPEKPDYYFGSAYYSCWGAPLDDYRRNTFAARIFRR